jgi:hypothetical protein
MKEMFSMDLLDLGKFYFMTHVEYYFDLKSSMNTQMSIFSIKSQSMDISS